MSKHTVLVIEDEKNIVELVKFNLEQNGYRVLTALRGDEGLDLAVRKKPDLILLDLMLPEIEGLEVCKILRNKRETAGIPIIMLTAKSEEMDKVLGLEFGADDYVTKPFSPRELIARVKAVLRRGRAEGEEKIYQVGTLVVDVDKYVVSIRKSPVTLTNKEFELLRALIEARGKVLSRETLLNRVWGYDASIHIETRTVDMHIGQLRKKIKAEAKRLVTVKNVGYRFDQEED